MQIREDVTMMHEVDEAAVADQMAEMFSPSQVDQAIRQAVQLCWMALPRQRRSPDELERQIRRIVDRALKDFREDSQAFARPQQTQPGKKRSKRG
jgi:hypothetical protein